MKLITGLDMAGAMTKQADQLAKNIETECSVYRDYSYTLFKQSIGIEAVRKTTPQILIPIGKN